MDVIGLLWNLVVICIGAFIAIVCFSLFIAGLMAHPSRGYHSTCDIWICSKMDIHKMVNLKSLEYFFNDNVSFIF
jgi:hypothetical protein